ncbi:hypothetical protein PF002_g8317 [Phytophthora fragariae]|uniref:Uncharacterized protein n=1 Tax=Phytophthora fragariae TaxID=53985 RepID=A0A6A3ZW82_9STRA|nr:hypothetical protein PF002_g8317 [Phytophthora fragariae]
MSPVYAKIKSSIGSTATITFNNEDDDSETTLRLLRATALTRKVDSSDAEGAKLSTWLSQAVCVKYEGHYGYGQVTGYSDTGLVIYTMLGPIEARRADICDTVYPVVVLLMKCREFPEATWIYEQLERIHETLIDRLSAPVKTNTPPEHMSIAQLVQGVLPEVSPSFDRICYWINARTGKHARLSVQHVVSYVYYVDGSKRAPISMEGSFGSSFCDVDVQPVPTQPQTSISRIGRHTAAPATRSSFFDVLEVDDGNETAADEAALARAILVGDNENPSSASTDPRNRLDHPRRDAPSLSTNPPYGVPPVSSSRPADSAQMHEETSDETEIRDLIRTHKPHLLTYHRGTRRTSSGTTKRTATNDEDGPPAKWGKFSFTPSVEQRRVHDAITSDAHRGKPPSEFVESLVSSSELWAYPGVATRTYDIEFGSRGLSFLHFAPVDSMLRLRLLLCQMRLGDAAPRDDAVAELKGCNFWPQSMLLTLVLWIDTKLEKYRIAVVRDIEDTTSTRHLISANFTSNNVELHGLLLVEQRKQVEAMSRPSGGQASTSSYQSRPPRNQRHGSNLSRNGSDDTHPPLPQQDGKDVCLNFLSKRGCPSKDPSVCIFQSRAHFYPAAISDLLRNFIRRRFGGVNSKYTNS